MRPTAAEIRNTALAILAGLSAASVSHGAETATAGVASGRLIVQRPTLTALGLEWMIEGDANRTAVVAAKYREKGQTQWREALPLMRLQGEKVIEDSGLPPVTYAAPNAFAGSIVNLTPDTEYEVSLALTDPDGVAGEATKVVTVKTRAEPMPATGGRTFHVYPVGYQGKKQEPAFTGLLNAYYTAASGADYYNVAPVRVRPGDIILVHKGEYVSTTKLYGRAVNPLGVYFDGTYYLTASGEPDKPIVIKAAGDGEVVFDGGGASVLFDLSAANYTYFEGITVRNAETAFFLGRKRIVGSSGFTLKHSRIENVARGVHGDWGGAVDFYIADNQFIGRGDPAKLNSWNGTVFSNFPGFPAPIGGPGGSEYAVKFYGRGHVIAYNSIANFHDGIDHATYGDPDGSPDAIVEENLPGASDVYGNDFTNMHDNCIEADGAARNFRVFRNRCFNSAAGGLSVQVGFGGPFYLFQNVLYNQVTGALKFYPASGILIYNNTIVGEADPWRTVSNEHFRNNLILAQGAHGNDGGSPPVFGLDTFTRYSTSDYNGFRPNPGAVNSFTWGAPADRALTAYGERPTLQTFATLKAFTRATGQDAHSILIDYDIFQHATAPDRDDVQRLYRPTDVDLRLKPRSKAIDAGVLLPNINDGYAGRRPDLGAYEYGAAPPVYGPRMPTR